LNIIQAGHKAVLELIKVAEEAILNNGDDDLSADKLKNAAARKVMTAVKDQPVLLPAFVFVPLPAFHVAPPVALLS